MIKSTKGFTLIEMLLALALLSIVLGALYSTFFLSHRAMEGIDGGLVKLQECRMAIDIIGREIDSAVYNEGNKYSVFTVEDRDIYGKQASRFFFTALSPLIPGLSTLSYSVEEKDGKLTLLKKVKSAYGKANTDKGTELLDDIENFIVEVKDNGKWIRTWNAMESKRVPDEIRVTITILLKNEKISLYETLRPKIGKSL